MVLRRLSQQLAVVTHDQHRFLGALELSLQPALGRHVQKVVRFVKEQHLVRTTKQGLQGQPFLLTPGQGADFAPLGLVVADAKSLGAAGIEDHFGVVPARIGVVGQGLRITQLGRFAVVLHQLQLQPVELGHRPTQCRRRQREQQIAYGRWAPDAADELAHHAQATAPGDRAAARHQITSDDLQQRGLARAVGSNQGDDGTLANAEGHIVEQHPPVGQVIAAAARVRALDGLRAIRLRAPSQHLLASEVMSHRGGQQRSRQPPILLARSVGPTGGRCARGRAGGVDEQAEQPLGLRPALDRVLLVHLARVLGEAPEPRPVPDRGGRCALGERLQEERDPRGARRATRCRRCRPRGRSPRRPPRSRSARSRRCALRLRWMQVIRKRRRSSPRRRVLDRGLRARQLLAATRAPASAAHACCSSRRGAPRRSAIARARTPGPALGVVGDGHDAALHAQPAAATAAHGPDDDRPPR